MEIDEPAPGPDPLRLRDNLLAALGEERGARYWSTLRAFIVAKLSKRELDAALLDSLTPEQIVAHNSLLRALIGCASRALPSVRESAKLGGARVPLGLWGSDSPCVPIVVHAPVGTIASRALSLALPRLIPNRIRPGVATATRVLPPSRGRVRSCAFAHPPSNAQVLALRRRVLNLLPTEPGAPRDVSDESLHVLAQAVTCHVRTLLHTLTLTRQGVDAAARGVARPGTVRPGVGIGRQVRRLSLADAHEALALSRRGSTAVSWQLPMSRTTPPTRWGAANLELCRVATGPHLGFATAQTGPPRWWTDTANADGSLDDADGSECEWEPAEWSQF